MISFEIHLFRTHLEDFGSLGLVEALIQTVIVNKMVGPKIGYDFGFENFRAEGFENFKKILTGIGFA